MAGYRETFGSNLDFAYQGGRGRGRDIAGTLQSGLAGMGSLRGMAQAAKQAQQELGRLKQRADDLETIRSKTDPASKSFAELTYRINETNAAMEKVRKSARLMGFDMLEKSLGGLTKKLLGFNTALLGLGFDFLIDSIKRVYELQERWTKAIGGFNMKLGGMTSGLQAATRAASGWSATIRGLTNGDIQEGIEMFADFTLAVGRVGKALDFQKWGLQAARGFGLGGSGAGQLAKVLDNIGTSADETSKLFGGDLVSAARAVDVPITILAKDIEQSSTYMARFGKEGTKTFVEGATYARKFTISMKQLQASVEGFDMFDDAAKAASKLNTAFGTMVNSMDLMMEDDPAKRLEMIRQQFLAQGKTFDTLKPKQVRYLSETLKLSEDQVAALLDVRNANVSYADFKAKEAAKEKTELEAKRNMEVMLRKTTQTMYAFGAAFDRITVAIANAIKPLLKVFGLAGDGNKKFKSFGQVMESVTKTVEQFFNSLAGNDRWNSFMETLAKDLIRAGSALKEFVMSGRAADLVGELADTMKSFYVWVRDLGLKALPYIDKLGHAFMFLARNVKYLAAAWVGIKGISMLGGAGGFVGGMGMLGKGAKGLFAGGSALSTGGYAGGIGARLGSSAMGAALGGSVAGTGGAIGGALGGLAGPLGAMLGTVIGGSIQHLVDYFSKDDEMEESQKDLADAQQRAALSAQRLSVFQDKAALALRQSDLQRQKGDSALLQLQKGKQLFEIQDKNALIERVKQLQGFGKNTQLTAQALQHLTTDGKLTKDMLSALKEASSSYNTKLSDLRAQTEEYIKVQQEKMGFDAEEIKTALLKNKQAAQDLEIAELRRQRSQIGDANIFTKEGQERLFKYQEIDKKIREAELRKNDLGIALERQQARVLDKQLALDMKRFQLETLNRNADFMKFSEAMKGSGMNENEMARAFLRQNPDVARALQETMGGAEMFNKVVGMAGGGIVSRPTFSMIGEAGPEAVIPLRSIARGRMGMPTRHGGQAAQEMVNYASGGSSGGQPQVVTAPVVLKLDSQTVARAVVTSIIRGR